MSIAACATCGGNVDPETGICPQCATQVNLRSGGTATETATVTGAGREATETPEISGYRVINSLGEGGMGAVYLAEETTLGRRVAVKVISSRVAPDAQSKARFLREARMLATIEHPHVVRVYSFGEVEGRPYLAMEYVEGETLMERIARLGKLSIDDALRITRDIVDALDAAWEKHVIHRDIKPSNILIDRRNRVRVADFGLAKPMDVDDGHSALTLSGLMVGTPHYISPEQAQGKDLDFRSDFYSLGIVLYHMLTGERPFQGSTPVAIVAKHLHEPMPLAGAKHADVPPATERLIQWMTQKEAENRPRSHQELLTAIDGLITRTPTPTTPMPTFSTVAIETPVKRASVRRIGVTGAALLLVAAAATFLIWDRRANPPAPFSLGTQRAEFVVAVAPFYGPDDDSAKEGRVMAALIERAVAQRLGKDNARVAGIEETKLPVRSHDEARELGTRLGASAVIWGEAFALRTETEIRPYVTLVSTPKAEEPKESREASSDTRLLANSRSQTLESIADAGSAPVKLQAEAPDQIEMRKTSASGIGDVVVLLAGIHALENEQNHNKALALFRQAPRSAETLRYEVQALLRADRRDEAQRALEEALKLDPSDAPGQALMGDLHLAQNRMSDAIVAYQRAAELGQPYTATRGILHEGKLYVRETYQHEFLYNGDETDSLYLIIVDPASQRVLARYSMPGVITSFRTEGGALVIGHDAGRDNAPIPAELRLTQGRFDRPLWPGPNLLWRMRSMKAGRVLAGNFLEEIDRVREFGAPGGRFTLRVKPAEDLPATLPDLERALRAEIARDPTQPWHMFFLALTLREQKRMAEANAAIEELLRRDYPGVPYYQYSWMLGNLERLRYTDWMDRLYPKALAARRAHAQPVTFSFLIERLIEQPFIRQAASNRDIRRGYDVLLRTRALGGLAPEGEDLVAAAWAKHFAAAGDEARAQHERGVMHRVHAHPFNYLGMAARSDYAAAAAAAAALTFLTLAMLISIQAVRRARREPSAAPTGTLWPVRLARLAGPLRAALIGLVIGGVFIGVFWLVTKEALLFALIAIAAVVALVLAWRRLGVSLAVVLAAISRRERSALVATWLVLLTSVLLVVDRDGVMQAMGQAPIGFADGMGHARVVKEFEDLLARGETPALSYAAAVTNHYAGNRERAEALYSGLPHHANAQKNRAALRAGRMPVAVPTAEELSAAVAGTRLQRWRMALVWDGNIRGPARVLIACGALLLLAVLPVLAIPPRDVSDDHAPPSRALKAAMLLLPGLYDIRRLAPWRALITLLLLFSVIKPLIVLIQTKASIPVVGAFTARSLGNLAGAFPLPSQAANPVHALRFTMAMAYPGAPLFWTIVLVSFAAGLTLHLLRVPAILREPRRIANDDQPTRVNAASVST